MFDEELAVTNEDEEVETFEMFQFPLSNDGDSNPRKEHVDGEQDEGSEDIEDEERMRGEDEIVDETKNIEIENEDDEVSIESWNRSEAWIEENPEIVLVKLIIDIKTDVEDAVVIRRWDPSLMVREAESVFVPVMDEV